MLLGHAVFFEDNFVQGLAVGFREPLSLLLHPEGLAEPLHDLHLPLLKIHIADVVPLVKDLPPRAVEVDRTDLATAGKGVGIGGA